LVSEEIFEARRYVEIQDQDLSRGSSKKRKKGAVRSKSEMCKDLRRSRDRDGRR
jgi:hypothetical protein